MIPPAGRKPMAASRRLPLNNVRVGPHGVRQRIRGAIAAGPGLAGADERPGYRALHARLLDINDLDKRLALIEEYLWSRLVLFEKKHTKINFIGQIVHSLYSNNSGNEKIEAISVRNNISARYLNMLFSQYTGLPPKLFCKINRFQHSLNLVNTNG